MSRIPALTGSEVIHALQRAGFEVVRQRGSHCILKHADGRQTVVPVHAGETLGRGLLRKILRDAELTPDEFLELL
ncbi:MAG: type II toxin-antitoxin system HicA family toxin [Fimbriimonadales bacterium]|nr:type II toxin-antitoxin system HicA family toxin [Fimbriimonadales bacterium]